MTTQLYPHFKKIAHRGPDHEQITQVYQNEHVQVCFGFHRLKIKGLDDSGNQPIYHPKDRRISVICNGEIYNYETLISQFKIDYHSTSDCEIIVHLYEKFGIDETLRLLDGEFAFILLDARQTQPIIYGSRDHVGQRFLEIGTDEKKRITGLCSEIKGIQDLCMDISQLTSGHYVKIVLDQKSPITEYKQYTSFNEIHDYPFHKSDVIDQKCLDQIEDMLTMAVNQKKMSDRPMGYFLSGGLDSTLVCAIAQRYSSTPINTFSFTFDTEDPSDPPSSDAIHAAQAATYIGTNHTLVKKTIRESLESIEHCIYMLESYDVTTIRAFMPMYFLCQYIKEKTDIRVIVSGEGPDEIGSGYLENHAAPTLEALQTHAEMRTRQLPFYDLKRGDRATAAHGLEAHFPYLQRDFTNFMLNLHPKLKHPKYNHSIEKYITRQAFHDRTPAYLSKELLWRPKEAFSDGVGYKWKASLITLAESKISDELFAQRHTLYPINTPLTKEGFYYRQIFNKFYPSRDKIIPSPWMPMWQESGVTDPSATVLKIHSERITK